LLHPSPGPSVAGRHGLGISRTLVKRLLELHDGRVTAASAGAGQGSEFRIALPLASASAMTMRRLPSAC
jgi:signal transduction histidine kinase